jgi:PASTA domain
MNVEEQLRDYKATLDAASDDAADARLPHAVVPIRVRPALIVAAVAVAATISVAFAAVGVARHSSTPPAAPATSTPTTPRATIAPTAIVPKVIGMRQDQADNALTAVGLGFNARSALSCSVPAGTVIRQAPAAGTRVASTWRVTVTVCSGPAVGSPIRLRVVACATQYGIVPAPRAHAPKTVTVSTPPFASPALSGYSDASGYVTTTAPVGWSCQALVAADGNVTLTATPPSGPGSVVVSDYSACQGCVYDAVCAVVPSAAADFPDQARVPCSSLATGARVTPLGKNVYEVYEPAFLARQLPVRTALRYRPPNASAGAASVRETCSLPTPQASECDALLAEFLALNPSAGA